MEKKWIIRIIISVILIIASTSLIFFDNCSDLNCTPMKNWARRGYCMCEDVSNIVINCTQAGQSPDEYSFGKYIRSVPDCCEGLKKINVKEYKEGNCFSLTDSGSICSDCGNNNCEEWENPCNCPEDCK